MSSSVVMVLTYLYLLIIQLTLPLKIDTNPKSLTLYFESYHYQYDFLNNEIINELKINGSLINIKINKKIDLDYFNHSHWNKIIQIVSNKILRNKTNNVRRHLLTNSNGRYAVSPVSMSWHEGVSFCSQHYGSIASIMTSKDNQLAKQICPWHCWIGLKEDSGQHMVYSLWKNGRKVTYSHWYPGEPNNDNRHGSDCGEIYADHAGLWNDIPCHRKRFVLCERGRAQLIGNYIAVQTPRTYIDADNYCLQKYGTHLATLHSFYDNEQAKKACNDIGETEGENDECWIGLKGPFKKWADGVYTQGYLKFSNWYDKQSGGIDKQRWRLILRLKDITKGYFNSKIRIDGIENPSDAEANTYSIIGQLNPDDYKNKLDNKYEFKLVFKNKDGSEVELIWKQSSWISAAAIDGYEAITIPGQTASQCGQFQGLGFSDSSCSYLDGNGKYKGCWFNSVGTICSWNGGIPGFQWKPAKYEALYIYTPQHSTHLLCGVINSNGKWYDKFCSEHKHFVCSAMSYSERLSPIARHSLQQNVRVQHYKQWTNEMQLRHMKELMKKEKEKEELQLDTSFNPLHLKQQQEIQKQKQIRTEKWEELRNQLMKKGIFDPYIKSGYFSNLNLNGRYGTDMRYSYPIHWKRRRRQLLATTHVTRKCVSYDLVDDIIHICIALDAIIITKHLNKTNININNGSIYEEIEYKMKHQIKNNGRQCFDSYHICVEIMNNKFILLEMIMMNNFDSSILNFDDNDEWDQVIHIINSNINVESIQKCIHLFQIKICIQSTYDKMNNVYLYSPSIVM